MTSKCSDCMICPNREDTFQNYHLILIRCSWLAGLDCDDSEIFKKIDFKLIALNIILTWQEEEERKTCLLFYPSLLFVLNDPFELRVN